MQRVLSPKRGKYGFGPFHLNSQGDASEFKQISQGIPGRVVVKELASLSGRLSCFFLDIFVQLEFLQVVPP